MLGPPVVIGASRGCRDPAIVRVMTPESALLHAALQRQADALAPIAARLQLAVAHPPIAPLEWDGPAAQGYADLEGRLRSRIRAADDMVSAALHHTKLALGQVGG